MKASTAAQASTAAPIAHGGGLIAARQRFPDAPEPWIDLSTGINPVPYPLRPVPPAYLERLPEPEQVAALEAAAARAYGMADPACVVAAPGTQALIHLLPRLLTPGSVAVISPTYAEHRAAWALAGHAVTEVASLAEAKGAAVTVLVRPNNPTGEVADAAALLGWKGLLVVDEAFADLEGCSLAPGLPDWGVLLLRSFGKTYGLAGVRLGFAVTAPPLASWIRQSLGPWAVSGPAVHAGLHALPDGAWREDIARDLSHRVLRLDALLSRAGARLLGGTRLFRLYDHEAASGLADQLGAAGILVRQFADRPQWVRFGLPANLHAWARLEDALGAMSCGTPR